MGAPAGGHPGLFAAAFRHTRAALMRLAYGLEAARAVLGHASRWIIEVYDGRDLELAMWIMRERG